MSRDIVTGGSHADLMFTAGCTVSHRVRVDSTFAKGRVEPIRAYKSIKLTNRDIGLIFLIDFKYTRNTSNLY